MENLPGWTTPCTYPGDPWAGCESVVTTERARVLVEGPVATFQSARRTWRFRRVRDRSRWVGASATLIDAHPSGAVDA